MTLPAPSPPARRLHDIWPGHPYPLGASWDGRGVNFALYSQHATAVELVLLDEAGRPDALALPDRTGPVWHGYVPGLKPGQRYGYRVHGPFDPARGHRFNPRKLLLDPYARALARPLRWHESLFGHDLLAGDRVASLSDSLPYAPLGMVADDAFDWEGDALPDFPWEDTVIYETHVRGVSKLHPGVPPELRGTYLGLSSEPILDHLKALGVTAVQLLPVQAFIQDKFLVDKGLANYWGYNPINYFAPEPRYAADPMRAVQEFKEMVKRLHRAGLEVIIDVVYNHTGEGNHLGPTLSWRGLDNRAYYKLSPDDPRYYMDYTGTGNTLDFGNAYVLQLTTDSLRYWVEEMHVDGFRFDLASALAREFYDVNMLSAFFKIIQQDPVLSKVKLIAEPWDVGAGGYQVGNFPWHWAEWNGKYRDGVRQVWRGAGQMPELATRLAGSSDLYAKNGRKPFASINFLTAHDGYTLEDLVSYERKHNQANLENNRDGHDHNLSHNWGVEGPTRAPEILHRREAAKRSLLATLLLSQGVPMLLGGDELSRTQGGNNNAYCQDNETSWYHWTLDERQQRFLGFVRDLVAFRKAHPIFRRRTFLTGHLGPGICKDVAWHHPRGREMTTRDWQDGRLRMLGMLLCGAAYFEPNREGEILGDDTFLVIFQAGDRRKTFVLPPVPDGVAWETAWDTHPSRELAARRLEPGQLVKLEPFGVTVLRGVE
jgi:isoamylase